MYNCEIILQSEKVLWSQSFKSKLLHMAMMLTQPGKRLKLEIKVWLNWKLIKIERSWFLLLFNQSHVWSAPTLKSSGAYPERNLLMRSLIPQRGQRGKRSNWWETSLVDLQTTLYYCCRVPLILNFKSPHYVIHMKV